MPVDIYFKQENYPYYDSEEIEVVDDLEIFLQQIEMLLTTPKRSLLGDPDFGINLESYLWNFGIGSSPVKQEIYNQILKYVDYSSYESIPFDIAISFLKGEIYDTMIVDIEIDGTKVAGYAVTP
jgi:hypothetical protein